MVTIITTCCNVFYPYQLQKNPSVDDLMITLSTFPLNNSSLYLDYEFIIISRLIIYDIISKFLCNNIFILVSSLEHYGTACFT